jgi:hypothetical protein
LKHKNHIFIESEYHGEKIVLIALYEKGLLRSDIEQLLMIAKKLNFFVIAVNNLKLDEPPSNLVNCYIERYNFGRDFGSYKAGFQFLFAKEYHLKCPRLLMLNDSVFYESSRCEAFLNQLMDSDTSVLGATENFKHTHHLGSFAISLNHQILCSEHFIRFWDHYRNTDLRPQVIKNGEIALSVLLQKIVSDPSQFSAAYDMRFVSQRLQSSEEISTAFALTAKSNFQCISAQDVWQDFISINYSPLDSKLFFNNTCDPYDLPAMKKTLIDQLHIVDDQLDKKMCLYIKSLILESFVLGKKIPSGSQIHSNNMLLFYLGLPLIKMDGFFRGALSTENVLQLSSFMQDNEKWLFEKLLLSRTHADTMLTGLKKLMYQTGFI